MMNKQHYTHIKLNEGKVDKYKKKDNIDNIIIVKREWYFGKFYI